MLRLIYVAFGGSRYTMNIKEAKRTLNEAHHLDCEWFLISSEVGTFLHGLKPDSEMVVLTDDQAIETAISLE